MVRWRDNRHEKYFIKAQIMLNKTAEANSPQGGGKAEEVWEQIQSKSQQRSDRRGFVFADRIHQLNKTLTESTQTLDSEHWTLIHSSTPVTGIYIMDWFRISLNRNWQTSSIEAFDAALIKSLFEAVVSKAGDRVVLVSEGNWGWRGKDAE